MKLLEVAEVNPVAGAKGTNCQVFYFRNLHLNFLCFRSSSNSLTSQRTSNTSLASQRASNNSLAGSLRARGLLPNVSTNGPVQPASGKGPTRSSELRLDFIEKTTPLSAPKLAGPKPLETQKSIDQLMEVPAPFPTTSNIGLGLRSPRTSPLTSPVTSQRAGLSGSGRATPASTTPTSPSTTPSSPGSSPNVMSPTVNSKGRSTLPSPNRVLHSVRSSPQLILNEIFEEAESCSDSESTSRGDSAMASAKSPGLRIRTTINGGHRHRQPGRASSAGPSVRPSTSPPSLVRRYEQRRQLAKARTASCSSSDASDDDNEGRKKRAEKLKTLPPRRDSHDDSSDPGCDGPGSGSDGAGISGGII